MKLLIVQFSPTFCHFIPFQSNALFSNTLSLCSSYNVRDQVSHPVNITVTVVNVVFFRAQSVARVGLDVPLRVPCAHKVEFICIFFGPLHIN
jgi:hypothetical protein